MANFRYSHLFTTKIGDAAIQAAAAKLNAAEIALAIADGQEKILFKNENGDVVSVATEEQILALLSGVTQSITNEVERATSAETALGNLIDAVDDKVDQEIADRAADVDAEEARATSAETSLQNAITAEVTRATGAEEALSDRISEIESSSTQALDDEIARAKAAEEALDDKIEAEKTRALSAETAIVDALADEVAERKANAVASVDYDSSGKTIDFYNANNVKIDSIDATDFIKDGMIDSVTLETTGGTTYLVIVWNTDAGKETTRIDIGDIFDANNYYTKTETDDLLDNKTDYQVNGTNGKAIMFNEADGGGAKFEHNDGTWSFAGVNDGGKNGLAGQIYAVEPSNGYKGTKLDVTVGGLYYTKGEESGKPVAERDVEANEVATKGNVANAKVTGVDVDANAGITLTFADGSTLAATEAEEITLSAGEF